MQRLINAAQKVIEYHQRGYGLDSHIVKELKLGIREAQGIEGADDEEEHDSESEL